jgi:hypothetical protein
VGKLINFKVMKKLTNKLIGLSMVLTILCYFGYSSIEPQRVSATAASDSVVITLNVTQGISITTPADVTMLPTLSVSQSQSLASTTWNVKTNDGAGYTLNLLATSSPALKQSASAYFEDYQTGAPNTWTATSTHAYFGYSGYGTDTSTATWGTGSLCGSGAGVPSTNQKWKGFTTSSSTTHIATRAATTTPAGVDTTVCYAADQNDIYVPSGTYTATIQATATGL